MTTDVATRCPLYADQTTLAALPDGERVLLIGGYTGYSNLGDILQLRSTIAWHRAQGRRPVVLLGLDSIPDPAFPARVRRWFDADALIFAVWSGQWFDASAAGLSPLRDAPRIPRLHVYGGGFMNSNWGPFILRLALTCFERFGVGHYVLSGQQVDRGFAPLLKHHFAATAPAVVGVRDPESLANLRAVGVEAHPSFDDSTEALFDLVRAIAPPTHSSGEAAALIHLNATRYTWAGGASNPYAEMTARLAELDRFLRTKGRPRVTLLQAYVDRRRDLLDTLACVNALEDAFPFRQYSVVDLAGASLDPTTIHAGAWADPGSVAVVSSYHTALLMAALKIPCYFQALNPYYRQKQSGLATDGPASLTEFLAAGSLAPAPLEPKLAQRREWLCRLAAAYAGPIRDATPTPAILPASPLPPMVFKPAPL